VIEPPPQLALVDAPDGERTTAALVGALAARLAALRTMTGADAFGALIAGYAAVGRQVATTAEGARLRAALAGGRAATNGAAVWTALGIDELAQRPPSPVLDDLRNDLALLLADDLGEELERPARPRGGPKDDVGKVDVVDYLVGMWVCSTETARTIELIAALTPPRSPVTEAQPLEGEGGHLLR